MVTFKRTKMLLYIFLYFSFSGCNTKINNEEILDQYKIEINNSTFAGDVLKKISLEFVKSNNIENSIIEVDLYKRDFYQLYIRFTCRGLYYFLALKKYPLFTYELENNSFFVFTGIEETLELALDSSRYINRNKGKCDELFQSCYFSNGDTVVREKECLIPYFDIPSSSPPPTLK